MFSAAGDSVTNTMRCRHNKDQDDVTGSHDGIRKSYDNRINRQRNRPTSDSNPIPPSSLTDPPSGTPSNVHYDPPSNGHDDAEADLDLPIALRKGKCSFTYPIASFVSYAKLSTSSHSFAANLDSIPVPNTVGEAPAHLGWRAAMIEEMNALEHNETWELPRLVAKGYAQMYGVDYEETFSPVAKLSSVRLGSLYGVTSGVAQGESRRVCKLKKGLYGLKQSPRAWFGKFSNALIKFGLQRSAYDHSVFYRSSDVGCILLVVYVDDIVVTGNDKSGIEKLKSFVGTCFQTKDLGSLKYFLGIENVQRAYDTKLKLRTEDGKLLERPEKYRRVVGKLNYLTITRLDIAFHVSVVSQFMSSPRTLHWDVVAQILRYLKGTPDKDVLIAQDLQLGIMFSLVVILSREGGKDSTRWLGQIKSLKGTIGSPSKEAGKREAQIGSWDALESLTMEKHKCFTPDCHSGYCPSGNTKNNRILRPTSSNVKNKVEDHPRSVKSKSNKMNRVVEPICNADVKHSMLNANSELICVTCNKCMFDAIHDMCVLDFVKDVNVCSKSKSAKSNKNQNIWNLRVKCSLILAIGCLDCSLVSGLWMLQAYDREPLSAHQLCSQILRHCKIQQRADIKDYGLWRLSARKRNDLSGKSKKHSHKPKAEDSIKEKLYLLHIDLYRPIRIQSINGKKYILVIVDDYSRFTWVKFLRSKDEVPEFVIKFLKMIQVLLNATVRNIKTDDGRLQPKADIGIFIGYAPTKKVFQINNRRTRVIIENIHVDFVELTTMASEQFSTGPGPQLLTPRTLSSGLVPNPPSSTPYVPPKK
ncbi:retrovirus-related pol polyprotein from transposon TNT 1-94 [Tanacetum coccineum]|uniref:Retrovirus-related pol polyprotein from transposon TNT 1-94 n=1 Tax=Tanacetum coccineum TaxID=301880 RepID=A0ABQ5GIS7_9ASTR